MSKVCYLRYVRKCRNFFEIKANFLEHSIDIIVSSTWEKYRTFAEYGFYMAYVSSQQFSVFEIPTTTNAATKCREIYEFYKHGGRRFTSFANKNPSWEWRELTVRKLCLRVPSAYAISQKRKKSDWNMTYDDAIEYAVLSSFNSVGRKTEARRRYSEKL